jgi:hypothetical protein
MIDTTPPSPPGLVDHESACRSRSGTSGQVPYDLDPQTGQSWCFEVDTISARQVGQRPA